MKYVVSIFMISVLSLSLSATEYIWIEGESASSTSLSDSHGAVSRHKNLSGGVSIGGGAGDHHATFDFKSAEAGDWYFYVRKFWLHGPFEWSVNGSIARPLNASNTQLLDSVGLGQQHMCINWAYVGKAKLKKGNNRLHIKKIPADNPSMDNMFVIDCLVFTKRPFKPSGLKKPGEKLGLADAGRWAFEPDYDTFEQEDALDLRGQLNEAVAGANGYVTVSKDGDFVDGKGKPVRFWCTQGAALQSMPGTDTITQHAKHVAKRGVNMYRHHGSLNPDGGNGMMPDMSELDAVHKLVAVMKNEGIYTTLSMTYPGHTQIPASWRLQGFNGGKVGGLLFFHDGYKKLYKNWLKVVLTSKNPYDKKKTTLAKDPALAIIQLQNENSLFWYDVWGVRDNAAMNEMLNAKYHAWLKKQKKPSQQINWNFWEIENGGNESIRLSMRFFAETMHDFNKEMQTYIRKDLKCKALINAGNWRTANPEILLDWERWSYTANDVIAVNRYVDGNGPGGRAHVNLQDQVGTGWMVRKGDYFQNVSATTFPQKLATNAKQVASYPYLITESSWVSPMSHQSEGPFLVAAYSALNGVDGYYWFALGSPGYDTSITKWQSANPSIMGGWPAASLMLRKNYLRKGDVVVHEERAMKDVWEARSPVIAEAVGFDQNRDKTISAQSAIKNSVTDLSYLVGPVEVVYDGNPAKSKAIDVNAYIKDGVIESVTGEIVMNTNLGLCTINAPKAQGATGFLKKAGQIKTDDVLIDVENDYATVLVVSLDDKALKSSKKILLQITTKCRPYGWRERKATFTQDNVSMEGFQIEDVGGAPWNVWNADGQISIKNKKLKKATLLDANLYPVKREVQTTKKSGAFIVQLPKDAMYIVLE